MIVSCRKRKRVWTRVWRRRRKEGGREGEEGRGRERKIEEGRGREGKNLQYTSIGYVGYYVLCEPCLHQCLVHYC